MRHLAELFSNPSVLYAKLSSFLRQNVTDWEEVRDFSFTETVLVLDWYERQLEREAALAVTTVPRFIDKSLVPIILNRNDRRPGAANIYGGAARYGDGTIYGYFTGSSTTFPIDDSIAKIGLLIDDPMAPTTVRFAGSDFVITEGSLTLAYDPFSGVQGDTIVLWGIDVRYISSASYDRYGIVLGIPDKRYDDYAAAISKLWAVCVQGPSLRNITAAIATAAGVAVAKGDEVVEAIYTQDHSKVVVTDKNVYRSVVDATLLVSVGDALAAGQLIDNAIEIANSTTAQRSVVTVNTPYGAVSLPNADVAVTRTGSTVRFDVIGSADAVAAFWSSVTLNEIATGKTLRDAVQFVYGEIPAQINPVAVFTALFGTSNLVTITTRPWLFPGSWQLEAAVSTALLRYLPPRTIYFQVAELTPPLDSTTAGGEDSVTMLDGVTAEDSIGLFTGSGLTTGLKYHDLAPLLHNYPG